MLLLKQQTIRNIMLQNITQNLSTFVQSHPFRFGASALGAVVAVECALCALKNLYGYVTTSSQTEIYAEDKHGRQTSVPLKEKHWEDLKVDLGGVATYGILASNYLNPYTGLLGSTTFIFYAFYKTQFQGCQKDQVYKTTWFVGNAIPNIWNAVRDVFSFIGRVFRQKPIVIIGTLLTMAVVLKMGAIPAALALFRS